MTFEIEIPDEWPPSLGFAVAKMIRQSLKAGFPVVVPVRGDTTPDQLAAAFNTIQTAIQEAGLPLNAGDRRWRLACGAPVRKA